jgi:hypothetical protein
MMRIIGFQPLRAASVTQYAYLKHQSISEIITEKCGREIYYREGRFTGDAVDLHSGRARFEYRLGFKLS